MTGLTAQLLLRAYAAGIFPMAESAESEELYWFDPEQRGVLPLDHMHVPRRLRRTIRSGRFEIRIDSNFDAVIQGCAESTNVRPKTWINSEIMRLYSTLFDLGFAHSVEAWSEDRLVGGLYGVALGGAFFGESMFSRQTDASKVALIHLVARLRHGGYRVLDTQFLTPHLAQFGAIEISRARYHRLLGEALRYRGVFPRDLPAGAGVLGAAAGVEGAPPGPLQARRLTS